MTYVDKGHNQKCIFIKSMVNFTCKYRDTLHGINVLSESKKIILQNRVGFKPLIKTCLKYTLENFTQRWREIIREMIKRNKVLELGFGIGILRKSDFVSI